MEHSLVDLLLLSLWALHTALAARATLSANPALPPAPAWAKGPEFRGKGHWEEYSVDQWRRNRDIINATDADGAEYDLLLFGDRYMLRPAGASPWACVRCRPSCPLPMRACLLWLCR